MIRSLCHFVLLCGFVAEPTTAFADLITFETAPGGGTPQDNSSLTSPYSITDGTVRFFFDVNKDNIYDNGDIAPVFEAAGGNDADPQGFVSNKLGGFDRAIPGSGDLGGWFQRQPEGVGPLPGPFIIQYDVSRIIDGLSGQIWDIDANTATLLNEQWLVDVLDKSGNVVASVLSPLGIPANLPESLDSRPWTFSFSDLSKVNPNVNRVRLTFEGTKRIDVGLAFDNYNVYSPSTPPHNTPEPSSAGLLYVGAVVVALLRASRCAYRSRYHR